eukprot:4222392-Alexandrium_andersonii.AAC.1
MASQSFPMGLLRRPPWPPPGQWALHVQHFPSARAVGRPGCTCAGPSPSWAFPTAVDKVSKPTKAYMEGAIL